MITAGDVADLLNSFGHDVTLRRIGDSPVTEVTVRAAVHRHQDDPVAAGVYQVRRLITIGNAEIAAASWPGPPQRGDQIVDGGRTMTIQSVVTYAPNGDVVKHDIETLGR